MDSWTFIIYGIIHYFFIYLIAPTVSILTTGSWQWNHWFQHPFDMLPSFWGLPLPLPSDITIWSMLILYIFGPSLRTGCFSKNPVSVCWRMVLKTKIWVLGMLIANGMSLLLSPVSWQSKENIYVKKPVCTHIYKYSCRQPIYIYNKLNINSCWCFQL